MHAALKRCLALGAIGIALLIASLPNAVAQTPGAAPNAKPAAASAKPAANPVANPTTARKLPPVDEGGSDASWVQFRAWLMAVLQRGDRRALAGVVDSNVLNALEAPRGIAAFRKTWDMDGTDNRLLRELSVALQLGSAWYQPGKSVRMLCAPSVPIKWPLDDVDPYSNGVIVVKDALVKDAPSHVATTLGNLSYDIVGVRDWEVADKDDQLQQRWVKIRYPGDAGSADSRDGYVPTEHIRSAIEHRACFARTAAGWRLMEYVLGIEYLGGEN